MSEYADFEFKMTEADICGNGINIWIQMTSRGNEDDVEVKELCTYVCIKNVKKTMYKETETGTSGKSKSQSGHCPAHHPLQSPKIAM